MAREIKFKAWEAQQPKVSVIKSLGLGAATPLELIDELKRRPGVMVLKQVSYPSRMGLDDVTFDCEHDEYFIKITEETK